MRGLLKWQKKKRIIYFKKITDTKNLKQNDKIDQFDINRKLRDKKKLLKKDEINQPNITKTNHQRIKNKTTHLDYVEYLSIHSQCSCPTLSWSADARILHPAWELRRHTNQWQMTLSAFGHPTGHIGFVSWIAHTPALDWHQDCKWRTIHVSSRDSVTRNWDAIRIWWVPNHQEG